MTLADYAQTTLQVAQANALQSVTVQVANINMVLKGNYLTAFNNWLINWQSGRITDRSTAPAPPNGYVVSYFDDPTTGPGSLGPYGDMVVQWPYPAIGNTPIVPMPAIPAAVIYTPPDPNRKPQGVIGTKTDALPPAVDGFPVGHQATSADGSIWEKFEGDLPFGVTYYWQCMVGATTPGAIAAEQSAGLAAIPAQTSGAMARLTGFHEGLDMQQSGRSNG